MVLVKTKSISITCVLTQKYSSLSLSHTVTSYSHALLVQIVSVADLGGGGGSGGCNPPKSSEPYIQNALLILC